MRYAPIFMPFLGFIALGLAGCDESTDERDDFAEETGEFDDDVAPEDEAELIRRAAIAAGLPMSDVDVPVVSPRTYASGRIQVSVSGHFEIDEAIAINTTASLSDGEYTWLQYGDSGSEAPNAGVTIGHGDMGISVAVGRYIATGTSTECSMETNVTATRVSGHFTCPEVTGYSQAAGSMGNVTIDVEFDAGS